MNSRMLTLAGVVTLAVAQLQAQSGDAAKGKELVASNACLTCHRVGDTGSRMGPDLTGVGDKRTPERLKSALLTPDEEVLPENRMVSVKMKDGTEVKGRILNHDAVSVQLIDAKEQLRSFQTANIQGYTILTKGLMPSYDKKLTPQQVDDIVAYLSSLKSPE